MDPFACRPVARDITIENTTNATIYVEFSFSSAFSGVELEIEKNNPNMEYLQCTKWSECVGNAKTASLRIQSTATPSAQTNYIPASTKQVKQN